MGIGREFASARASSAAPLLSVLLLAGCAGSANKPASQGLPEPGQASQINTYVGTQSPGDVWKVTFDHPAHTFGSTDVSTNSPPVNGLFTTDSGFLDLSETNTPPAFQPAGFALEIPGRAALVRPGDSTTSVAPLVMQDTCLNINGGVTLQFVALPNSTWSVSTDTAYGNLQMSTSGPTWSFSNFQQFTLVGGSAERSAVTLSPGVCAPSPAGIVVSIPPSQTTDTTRTMALGPSGFFVLDEGAGNPGKVGVIQPATALSTSGVVNSQYLGFIYEPAAGLAGLPVTQMAAFGCAGSSCPTPPGPTSLVGGAFPSDDPTMPNNTDTTITLGPQNSKINGLYNIAQVTVPDLFAVCKTPTGTCTFQAVAVVGSPEGKFAVFLIAQDVAKSSPMVIYLYQQ